MTVTTDTPFIEIAVSDLQYPCVYKKGGPPGHEKFGVSFDAELVPEDWRLRLHRSTIGKPARAKSNFAPLVSEKLGRYELMAMLFEQADTRNIPRDRLLRGVPATIKLTLAHVERHGVGEFDTLVLLGVTVDVDDMKWALEAIDV